MAGELTITINGRFESGIVSFALPGIDMTIDQTTPGILNYGTASLTTSESDMPVGEITTNGWLLLINLDDTNAVYWGPKVTGAMVDLGELKPLTGIAVRLKSGVTIRWKTAASTAKVYHALFQA